MNLPDVRIKATDGSGSFSAFMSFPAIFPDGTADTEAPGIIVIQEIFGVNKNMRDICARFSQAGYVAICPDLFWRQEPGVQLTDQSEADWKKALQLYQGFNTGQALEDLKATLTFVRNHRRCNGKVGTIGYCLGGKLAWLMASGSDAACNVSYYGVGIEDVLGEAKNIRAPLLMHIAEKDKFVPGTAQTKILKAAEAVSAAQVHVYPGVDHAFARVGGDHYDREAAHQADTRTADFLARCLDG